MKSIFSLKSTSYFGSISYLVIDSYLESISIMASTFDFYFCNQRILSHECFFSGKHFNTWKLFLTRKVIAFDAHTSVAASAETETRNWFTLERAFIVGKIRLSRNRDVANDGSDDVKNYEEGRFPLMYQFSESLLFLLSPASPSQIKITTKYCQCRCRCR